MDNLFSKEYLERLLNDEGLVDAVLDKTLKNADENTKERVRSGVSLAGDALEKSDSAKPFSAEYLKELVGSSEFNQILGNSAAPTEESSTAQKETILQEVPASQGTPIAQQVSTPQGTLVAPDDAARASQSIPTAASLNDGGNNNYASLSLKQRQNSTQQHYNGQSKYATAQKVQAQAQSKIGLSGLAKTFIASLGPKLTITLLIVLLALGLWIGSSARSCAKTVSTTAKSSTSSSQHNSSSTTTASGNTVAPAPTQNSTAVERDVTVAAYGFGEAGTGQDRFVFVADEAAFQTAITMLPNLTTGGQTGLPCAVFVDEYDRLSSANCVNMVFSEGITSKVTMTKNGNLDWLWLPASDLDYWYPNRQAIKDPDGVIVEVLASDTQAPAYMSTFCPLSSGPSDGVCEHAMAVLSYNSALNANTIKLYCRENLSFEDIDTASVDYEEMTLALPRSYSDIASA